MVTTPVTRLPIRADAPGAIERHDPVEGASALECLLGAAFDATAPAGVSPFALLRVAEGATLVHEGAPAKTVYLVQAGTFKLVRTGIDGYEQVLDFAGRHELIGCEGLARGQHLRGAIALEESWVFALPLVEVQRLCQAAPRFAARWQSALAAEIVRGDEMAWLTAAVGAEKRTARFLLLTARRMAERGQSARRLLLRMGRREIASHLGLAHESVSRSLSTLAAAGLIAVHNREVEIKDTEALEAFSTSTRGYPDGPARRGAAALQPRRRANARP